MEAAALAGKRFVVLDRPNPVTGRAALGPCCTRRSRPSSGGEPIAQAHGMTVAELARLFNGEFLAAPVELETVRMSGWRRSDFFDATGLPWVPPSPNMPTPDTALVYSGTCLFEGTNLSEGRGTTRPFELLGAEGIDRRWAAAANALGLPGVRFREAYFAPTFSKFQGKTVGGVQLHVHDREAFDPVRTGIALLVTAKRAWSGFAWRPDNWIDKLTGSTRVRTMIDAGAGTDEVVAGWQERAGRVPAVRKSTCGTERSHGPPSTGSTGRDVFGRPRPTYADGYGRPSLPAGCCVIRGQKRGGPVMPEMSVEPYRELTFDADGDVDAAAAGPAGRRSLERVTDLVDVRARLEQLDRSIATRLYSAFFAPVPGAAGARPACGSGTSGVVWPSMRFSDEPIPDFKPSAVAAPPTARCWTRHTQARPGRAVPRARATVSSGSPGCWTSSPSRESRVRGVRARWHGSWPRCRPAGSQAAFTAERSCRRAVQGPPGGAVRGRAHDVRGGSRWRWRRSRPDGEETAVGPSRSAAV